MAATISVKLDLKRLEQLERQVPGRADQVVGKIAFDLAADAQANMNTVSPAPAGEPPGIVTGNLKNSIQASKVRQFLWQVVVGASYGIDLEFGTVRMAARPFMRPAINRIVPTIPDEFKAILE